MSSVEVLSPAKVEIKPQIWLPLLPLVAIPFVGTPQRVDHLILISEFAFFAMAFRNPLWLLGGIALSEFSIRNFVIEQSAFTMSSRLLMSMAAITIAIPLFARGETLGSRAKMTILTGVGLIVVATLSNFINVEQALLFQFLRFIICGLVILVAIPLVVKNREDLLQVSIIVLAIATISALVAVAQQIPGAPSIASVPNGIIPTGLEYWEGRSLGLGENPIYLTNDLMLVLFPLVGILLVRGTGGRLNRTLAILVVLFAAALYFSLTRSWAFSALGATIGMSFVLRGAVQKYLLLLLMVGALVFWYQAASSENRYSGEEDGGSAAARPVLWSAAVQIALDYPILGIGYDQFVRISPRYVEPETPTSPGEQTTGVLGRYEPHNDFLDVWSAFGTAAFVFYILLYLQSGYNYLLALRTFSEPLLKGIALGGMGALVAFAVNSLFHNLFGSTLTLWILAGFSLALVKVAEQTADKPSESQNQWAAA